MLTAQQIRKKFRNSTENGYAPSLYAINRAAEELGYKRNNRRQYNDALYTALWGRLERLHQLDSQYSLLQAGLNQSGPEPTYTTYNAEPDRKDYDWELDECIEKAFKAILSL